MAVVLVHGAGRSGPSAWPGIARPDAVALELSMLPSLAAQARAVAAATGPGDVLVAHSLGAVPALLALPLLAGPPRAVLLSEPALYDLVRGDAAIEAHIAAVEAARAAHRSDGAEAFWRLARPIFGGGPFDPAGWAAERAGAERLATIESPWGHGLDQEAVRAALGGVPTTVATGGWSAEYEAIGTALSLLGARHVVLEGTHHRPHDDPRFAALVDAA